MCNENKNEECVIVHPSAQPPPSLSLCFLISAHDKLFLLQSLWSGWAVISDTEHGTAGFVGGEECVIAAE